MHQGKVRKFTGSPFILHPMEVAQILSTMTDDQEVIAAGILHDIVEDTDGTLGEIKQRFGDRVAALVDSESEKKDPDVDPALSWQQRKEDSLLVLKNSTDVGVKMLWLADKLANIRSLARQYSENGEETWQSLHQHDPAMQCWYYKTIAETVELSLNKTGAFKELIKHINYIWPGTFDSEKAKYKKYKDVSVEGCKLLGRGAKGDVYRYDDELVIKVFNEKNTYKDVEREIALSRKAFILGIPTAISFGIVSVGECYGAMYEMVESDTLSQCIERAPGQVDTYAGMMADLALMIHSTEVTPEDGFPDVMSRIRGYVNGGVAFEDDALTEKCNALLDTVSGATTLVHGDFHTGNVFLHNGEPLLIDMDRISTGHPIIEISDLLYFYLILGEKDPSVIENFMGFSYDVSKRFFRTLLTRYLKTEDEERIREVMKKASIICYIRMINKLRTKETASEHTKKGIAEYLEKLRELTEQIDTLTF